MSETLALLAFGPDGWGDELAAGLWLTVRLALVTLPFGIVLGLAVALAKDSRSAVARLIGEAYTTVFRGLPELLTVFLVYFGAPRLLGFDIGAFPAGVIALGLVFGAFSSEAFLGALRGVPAGQREAALALGMTPASVFRLVVLPQALRLALPGLTNNWLVLLKDTSLVSAVALTELMRQSNLAALATRKPFLFYGAACALYLAMSWASILVARRLEARAARGAPALGARR